MRLPSLLSLFALLLLVSGTQATEPSAAEAEFFEKEVRPLLVQRCYECHDGKKQRGGLIVSSRDAILRGGDSGPAAVAGKPAESLLVKAIGYGDELRMPPKNKLPQREIEVLTRWVALGLPWPKGKAVATAEKEDKKQQGPLWSLQPIRLVQPPAVKDPAWVQTPIDRFILAKLEDKGLRPAAPAERRALIRRATFDLTGLPPTPGEVEDFVRDTAPNAFAKVVDRLLASPAYGERWGRHWLDVVRYADSVDQRLFGRPGFDIFEAWRYRDWVVDAFNRDLPYDRFLRAQIAGDLLPEAAAGHRPAAWNGGDPGNAGLVATTVLAIGPWEQGEADKEKMMTDIVDDQIDLVGRGFLGLTLACARCHDHKFDPISTNDYYGLAGIFFSSHVIPAPGDPGGDAPRLNLPMKSSQFTAEVARHKARLAEMESRLQEQTRAIYREHAAKLVPQAESYAAAAWSYLHSMAGAARPSLQQFAAQRKLNERVLERWTRLLEAGASRTKAELLDVSHRSIFGKAGIPAWKRQTSEPWVAVNPGERDVTVSSFTIPARGVAVHPGPASAVAVLWQSPVAGRVTVTGSLRDGDASCGDGVAWTVRRRSRSEETELASGDFPNGGKGDLSVPATLVKPGDLIELAIHPRENYGCDTTIVELRITAEDGKRWDLAADIVPDLLQGNPHPSHDDGSWQFVERPSNSRPVPPGTAALVAALEQHQGEAEAVRQFLTRNADDPANPLLPKAEDEKEFPEPARAQLAKLRAEIEQLRRNEPKPALVHGVKEGGVPGSRHAGIKDAAIHIRGSYTRLGDIVPRHLPEVLARDRQPKFTGSGRKELAAWLVDRDNPLTARVLVNRVWHYHFGAGIVRTPGNFGSLGDRPSHPELLDSLAARFMHSGWSIKTLHREIMLSATYQQASRAQPETQKADPDNRLFGRVSPRRLEAEAVRDAMLAVAGRLDPTLGGPSFRTLDTPRRSLYLMTQRSDSTGYGRLFDGADPRNIIETRTVSTVAPQALFLLNNDFVLAQAEALAKRLQAAAGDDQARIVHAYQLLFGRPPREAEISVGARYLAGAEPAEAWLRYAQVLLAANEFVFVD